MFFEWLKTNKREKINDDTCAQYIRETNNLEKELFCNLKLEFDKDKCESLKIKVNQYQNNKFKDIVNRRRCFLGKINLYIEFREYIILTNKKVSEDLSKIPQNTKPFYSQEDTLLLTGSPAFQDTVSEAIKPLNRFSEDIQKRRASEGKEITPR